MNRCHFFALNPSRARFAEQLLSYAVALPLCILAGCGGGSMTGGLHPSISGETAVTVLAASTANDKLAAFSIQFEGITLTSRSGKTVDLIAAPVTSEFIHLNGVVEPLASVSVPQDVYTSVNVTLGSAWFTCTNFTSSTGLQNTTFEDLQVPASTVTVILPTPIAVTGTSIGIKFDMQVPQSESHSDCGAGGNAAFSITPTFTVSSVAIADQPTDGSNGKATGLHGLVSSIDASGNSFSVAGADGSDLFGPTWQLDADGGTKFQGVGGLSKLVPGMPVDLDAVIQQDGSLLATRVSVYDTDTTNLNFFTGPINLTGLTPAGFSIIGQEQEGHLDKSSYFVGAFPVNSGSAKFRMSGAMTNLQDLPFAATFNASNMVSGQNISVTSHVSSLSGKYLPVSTVTLMPQTINGTVSSISSDGAFTAYTVVLAAYDTFSNVATQPSQAGGIMNPNIVVVYVDDNAQQFNSTPLSVGGLFRFNGLVFNENGNLRMDCAQINDGVAE